MEEGDGERHIEKGREGQTTTTTTTEAHPRTMAISHQPLLLFKRKLIEEVEEEEQDEGEGESIPSSCKKSFYVSSSGFQVSDHHHFANKQVFILQSTR